MRRRKQRRILSNKNTLIQDWLRKSVRKVAFLCSCLVAGYSFECIFIILSLNPFCYMCMMWWRALSPGNEYFKQQKYPEAVKHYSESLRRNPKDPKVVTVIRAFSYVCDWFRLFHSNAWPVAVIRHIVTELHATPNLGLFLRDWRMQRCALNLILLSQRVIQEKVLFNSSWKSMIKPWKLTRRVWNMTLRTRNCLMVLEGIYWSKFVLHSSAPMVERVKLCSHFFYRCVGQLNKASRGDLSPEELKERQVSLLLWLLFYAQKLVLAGSWSLNLRLPFCRPKECKIQKFRTFSQILSWDR